ncbi:MAG: NAD-dependent epimerase/dehydratase family protein [Promethearchaeota archaeon]|nr:MAG: NAD-dependent epimerase/dehydratase family protein [Candidatus Lokiarchaeota archaeon]
MKQILITGAGGFIGSHLAEFYAEQDKNNKIIVIDNLSRAFLFNQEISEKFLYNWKYLHNFENIQFIKEDLNNYKLLKTIFNENNFELVIHTAGQTAVDKSIKNPYIDFKNNLEASFKLLEAIRISKTNPKIIYCSTNKVYGNKINELPLKEVNLEYKLKNQGFEGITESFKIDQTQHTPYGTSKVGADLYFQEYGYTYGLKTGIFRMSCIYGPRQIGMEAQGWISHFIISALNNRLLKIYGSGKQTRDILYITDLINLFENFFKKDVKNEVFSIGGGIKNTISPMKLINILEELLNKSISYKFEGWREGDQKYFVSDISKAQEILSWNPQISVKEGLNLTINWYKQHHTLFR